MISIESSGSLHATSRWKLPPLSSRSTHAGRSIYGSGHRAEAWRPSYSVLLPGGIVAGHGSRDDDATVDIDFHQQDDELLRALGVREFPQGGRDLSWEPAYVSFRSSYRRQYYKQANRPHDPNWNYLNFTSSEGAGPLDVLTVLSDEGKALYTGRTVVERCHVRNVDDVAHRHKSTGLSKDAVPVADSSHALRARARSHGGRDCATGGCTRSGPKEPGSSACAVGPFEGRPD